MPVISLYKISGNIRLRLLLTANGGFTLIEILVALAIISLIVPVAVSIIVAGSNYITHGGNETIAVKIAQERMEEVKSMGFTEMEDEGLAGVGGGITEKYGDMEDFPAFKRVTQVTFEENDIIGQNNQLKIARIKVTVYWDGHDNPEHERSIQHETLHANR